jgi:DNA-binding NarL/FixJ family response regulator
MMQTSVMLADDHQVVLEGLKALLSVEPDLKVIGEANDGLSVLPLVEKLQPTVLVLDLMMPGMNGLEVTRQLHDKSPSTRIVVLSMHANEAYVAEALRNGASGYVLKHAPGVELVRAIRSVTEGKRYLSPPLTEEALERWALQSSGGELDPYDTLSSRERQVLQLAAEGLTNSEIGDKLTIGKRTVETHRANLMRKLALKSHAELVRYAIRRGLVSNQ